MMSCQSSVNITIRMRLVANYAGEDYNIHGEKCEEQVEQCEIIIYMVRSVRSRWNSVRL